MHTARWFSWGRAVGGIVLLGLLAACGDVAPTVTPTLVPPPATATAVVPPPTSAARTPGPVPTLGENYTLRITRAGQLLKAFTAAELRAVPQQTVPLGGRDMSGAPLRAYLALAGVTTADTIVVTGTNSTRSGGTTQQFTWAATEPLLLGVNQRGAGKLFGPTLPGEQWVVDITEIAVLP